MVQSRHPSCLVVAHNYHPATGAAATRLELLATALRDEGVDVTVLTSSTSGELAGPVGERIVGTSRSWMPASRLFRTAVLGLRAAVEARRHDVVVSDPPPHVAVAAMAGARAARRAGVFYYCDSWASVANSRRSAAWSAAGRLFSGLEGLAERLATATVAATPSLATQARPHTAHVELVRNGTDLRVYTPEGPGFDGPSLPEGYLLYAGTMGLVHGADVFVEAARRMWADGEDVGLVFIGGGTESAAIREAAATSDGRIVVLDPDTPETVAALYRGCRGALSSMRPVPGYEDAWPVKTLAAMSCSQVPVYVSDGDLAEDLRREGLGFVESYSVEGARRAMTAALALDDGQRAEMGRRCHEYASEHFDQRAAARTVADLVTGLARR